MKLTNNEKAVLRCLYESADGNGHDFGFIDDGRGALPMKRSLAGVISSLVKKNIIRDWKNGDELTRATGYATSSQFTWQIDVNEVEKLLK